MHDHQNDRRLCLILEDSKVIREGLKGQLKKLGFQQVKTCQNCSEAFGYLDELAPELPDLALLDVSLEDGETSLPIARKLRQSNVPCIVASGHGKANEISAELPDVIAIRKPVFNNKLAEALNEALG